MNKVVLISDLSAWNAYFTEDAETCDGQVDVSAFEEVKKHNDLITMGKVVAKPYRLFDGDDVNDLKKYGLGKKFAI